MENFAGILPSDRIVPVSKNLILVCIVWNATEVFAPYYKIEPIIVHGIRTKTENILYT